MGGNRARGSREQTQSQTQHKQRPQVFWTPVIATPISIVQFFNFGIVKCILLQ